MLASFKFNDTILSKKNNTTEIENEGEGKNKDIEIEEYDDRILKTEESD